MADDLERRLGELAGGIDWPVTPDLAAAAGRRIRQREATRRPAWWRAFIGRPVRRGLLVAIALLLVVAATVAAVGIVLPGLRIVTQPPGATPIPPLASASPGSSRPLGARLGLGDVTTLDAAADLVGFRPRLPAGIGAPDEAWLNDGRLTLLWRDGARLPRIGSGGIGLLLTEFRGTVDEGYFQKQVYVGTTVEPVSVGGRSGWWLTGEPHALFYVGPNGERHDETRRLVGDVLLWRDGELTLRLESGLGRDATIELAETLAPAP